MLVAIYTLGLSALLQVGWGAAAFQTCVVPHRKGSNDAAAIHSLLSNCSSNSRILFEKGKTYNISTPIVFGTLHNVEIAIEGNLELPKSIPYVQSIVNGSGTYWFSASGTNVTVSGSQDPKWGWIDSFGDQWWRAAQSANPGGLPSRPHLWRLNINNSAVRWLKLRKPIAWAMSLGGNNIHAHDIMVDASYDLSNPASFPFNTDGFDLSGENIVIENSHVFNGDDCVAVGSNSINITIRGVTCEGGHGLSVSGTHNISRILFDNNISRNSLYAARFKSSLNSVGNVSDVTWSNMKVFNATFPIFATGVYVDQNTNRPNTTKGGLTPISGDSVNSTATYISNFLWKNITGTINSKHTGDGSCISDPCWYAVAGATSTEAIVLQLLNNSATNIVTRDIDLKPIDGKGTADVLCNANSFTDGGKRLGFVCRNGPYQATD